MAYQRRNKGPRYQSTGQIYVKGTPGIATLAANYKRYLAGLMSKLQNKARQAMHRSDPYYGRCHLCQNTDTSKFYVSYDPVQTIDLCQSCHKNASQHRGSVYDQLVRHGISVLSWEDWKNGQRPVDN